MNFFPLVILLALVAVTVVLFLGLFSMARGGNPARSNKLMQWRVALQALAILLIVIALWAAKQQG